MILNRNEIKPIFKKNLTQQNKIDINNGVYLLSFP